VGVVEWWRRANVGRNCAVAGDGGGGRDTVVASVAVVA
jgi:hypothetical protein